MLTYSCRFFADDDNEDKNSYGIAGQTKRARFLVQLYGHQREVSVDTVDRTRNIGTFQPLLESR